MGDRMWTSSRVTDLPRAMLRVANRLRPGQISELDLGAAWQSIENVGHLPLDGGGVGGQRRRVAVRRRPRFPFEVAEAVQAAHQRGAVAAGFLPHRRRD